MIHEKENIQRLFEIDTKLMVHASDSILRTYQQWLADWRRGLMDFKQMGELILEIRKDMGQPNTNITLEDILR